MHSRSTRPALTRALTFATALSLIAACVVDDEPAIAQQGSHLLRLDSLAKGGETTAVILAAGDIARCQTDGDEATARLLDSLPGVVLALGDNVYNDGSAAEYQACYEPSWGRHRARTRPTPGNHEYKMPGAQPYFDYFGAAAGSPGQGYYSFDVAGWHVISLNSNVDVREGSRQERWLRADLAAHRARCILAFSHHPRFSSGRDHGSTRRLTALWRALYDAGADVVVQAHDHVYERLAPLTPDGRSDPVRGIRSFVVGTGGAGADQFGPPLAASEARYDGGSGVLKLVLFPDRYSWEFITAGGAKFTDRGTGRCQ